MRSSSLHIAGLALAVAAMASCGGGSSTSPSTTPATTVSNAATVSITGSTGNQSFSPNPVMVSAGGTVTFKNNDSITHHIVLDDGTADLGEVAPGGSKTATLKNSSSNFHCVIHPTMVGSINGSVAPTAPAPPCDVYGYGC